MSSPEDAPTPARPGELDTLRRERMPSDRLEERVVRALRNRGVLGSSAHADPRRRRLQAPAWRVAAAVAALALFLGGYALGQRHGAAAATDLLTAVDQADTRERAAWVQHTGSLWVTALTALADAAAAGDSTVVGAGREAALAGLRAAVQELTRLEPDDTRVARVADALSDGSAPPTGDADRTILWF